MREEPKNRHGCLMTWLVLLIVVNSFAALVSLVSPLLLNWSRKMVPGMIIPDIPVWQLYASIAFPVLNVVFVVAIILWKKWGFWGYCASSIAGLAINLLINTGGAVQIPGGTSQALVGSISIIISVAAVILGILILFGVLHIGKENKGWRQLK